MEWVSIKKLWVNPFVYEGKIVVLVAAFEHMVTATSGMFIWGMYSDIVIVSCISKDMFTDKGVRVVLVAEGIGKTDFDMPFVGRMKVPELRFRAVLICRKYDCSEIIP